MTSRNRSKNIGGKCEIKPGITVNLFFKNHARPDLVVPLDLNEPPINRTEARHYTHQCSPARGGRGKYQT